MNRKVMIIILLFGLTCFKWLIIRLIMILLVLILLVTIRLVLILILLNWGSTLDWILFCWKLNVRKICFFIKVIMSWMNTNCVFYREIIWILLIIFVQRVFIIIGFSLGWLQAHLWRVILTSFYCDSFHFLKCLCHLFIYIFNKLFSIFNNIF